MDFKTLAGLCGDDSALADAEILYGRVSHAAWQSALVVADDAHPAIPGAVAAAFEKLGKGSVTLVSTPHDAKRILERIPGFAARIRVVEAPHGAAMALHAMLAKAKSHKFDLAVLAESDDVNAYGLCAVLCERLVQPGGMLALGGYAASGAHHPTRPTLELLSRLYPAVCSCSHDTHWGWATKGAAETVLAPPAAVHIEEIPAPKPAPAYQCPLCEQAVEAFLPFGATKRSNAKCPHCGALERHRLFWCYVKGFTDLFDGRPKDLLHIAPEQILADKLMALPGVNYLSADLDSPRAMVKMDLTDIQYPEGTWDVILCSHVLEHIPDDRKAMSEMLRVLKPGGWLMVQVPTYGDSTYEDWSITSEEGRLEAFLQRDHVRKYGTDIADRLRDAGFNVKVERPATLLDAPTVRKHALKDQYIFFCSKP